ncbi:hypothetical protein DFH06DRAFT_323111 [Mycena polygramma]|nr:hypothetical protein DFH06DRAFT_323111 [Mycena polygramma]
MSPLTLNAIPPEILLEIFAFVGAETVVRACSLVCQLWKHVIDGSTEIRFLVELWADAMVPGDSGGLTFAERLDAVQSRRRAWQNLEWVSKQVIPIEASSRAYELVDGVFAQQTVGLDESSETFSTIWLPSTRDRTMKTTLVDNLDVDPRDFVLDPTQDLVAFVYEHPEDVAHVDCRALSTLQPHPLATTPALSFPVTSFATGFLLVDLAEDVISLYLDQSLVILNWREGVVVLELDCSRSMSSFSLLTPRAYILAYGGESAKIEIWSFKANGRSDPPCHMVTLMFPETVDSHYISTQVHSGPFRADPAARKPFSKCNEGRLCVISMDYGDLFVHHRYLLKYLSNSNPQGTVSWDDWGPCHSRILPPMGRRWFRYVHGERVVLPPDPDNPRILQVLDFSMTATRPRVPLGQTPPSPHSTSELHTESSTLYDELLASKSVTTSLPYRDIVRYVDEEHAFYLIDEEQIIGVNDMESQMTVYTF